MSKCSICGAEMTEEVSLRQNCGGDCLMCMASVGDPDCIEAAFMLQHDALKELAKYFTSGNSVPVERATILAKDFWRITGLVHNA